MIIYNGLDEKDLPREIQDAFLKSKINIFLDNVKKAGMLEEFIDFIEDIDEINDISNVEDVFIRFAQKYSDKFYIVPQEEKYSQAPVG